MFVCVFVCVCMSQKLDTVGVVLLYLHLESLYCSAGDAGHIGHQEVEDGQNFEYLLQQ